MNGKHKQELSEMWLYGFVWGLICGTGIWTLGLALIWRYIA